MHKIYSFRPLNLGLIFQIAQKPAGVYNES